jgi:hypothetical protein
MQRMGVAIDMDEYMDFLTEIGYVVPEGPPFQVSTSGVDPEISVIRLPWIPPGARPNLSRFVASRPHVLTPSYLYLACRPLPGHSWCAPLTTRASRSMRRTRAGAPCSTPCTAQT